MPIIVDLYHNKRKRYHMNNLFIEYPKCSTCQKAKKFLEKKQIDFIDRHIIENNPTKEELKEWINQSGYPIKKFFNTSGLKYKALNLKEKLPLMTEEEQLELLATDGMLIKRPLWISSNIILTGFKQEEWEKMVKDL